MIHEVSAAGPVVSSEKPADAYDSVSIDGPFDVTFTVGQAAPVKIEAQQEVVDATTVKVDNGTLLVKLGGHVSTRLPIKVTISGHTLRNIAIRGACRFEVVGDLPDEVGAVAYGASHLEATGPFNPVVANGASSMVLKGISAELFSAYADGASSLSLSGTVGGAEIVASGASTVGPGLVTKTAKVKASGASHVEVSVQETIDAEASGASEVLFSGPGKVGSSKAGGASTIRHMDGGSQ